MKSTVRHSFLRSWFFTQMSPTHRNHLCSNGGGLIETEKALTHMMWWKTFTKNNVGNILRIFCFLALYWLLVRIYSIYDTSTSNTKQNMVVKTDLMMSRRFIICYETRNVWRRIELLVAGIRHCHTTGHKRPHDDHALLHLFRGESVIFVMRWWWMMIGKTKA